MPEIFELWIQLSPYLVFLLILVFIGAFFAAPWLPTHRQHFKVIEKMASFKTGDKFYELGCGDGRLISFLVKRYKINAVGIEISPILYLISKIKFLFNKNVQIKFGNFLKTDLSQADIVYVFLTKKAYPPLKIKLGLELKQGSKIITAIWPVPGWEIKEKYKLSNKEFEFYLYQK